MSIVFAKPDASVVVRGNEAEVVGLPKAAVKLLVDSSSAAGTLSTVQVSLDVGADGAKPHRHEKSAEMFYVLEGALRVLSVTRSFTRNEAMSSWCRHTCRMHLRPNMGARPRY